MSTTKTQETKTLKDATELYLTHLRAVGKKPSTVGTAKRTLDLLIADMGEDKEIAKIMPVHVSKFFKSEPATMLRGKPRAEPSVLQIRRIVRSALVWWHSEGLIATIPLPADEKRFIQPKGEKKAAGTRSGTKSGTKSKGKKKATKQEPEPPAEESTDETEIEQPAQLAQPSDDTALITFERPASPMKANHD